MAALSRRARRAVVLMFLAVAVIGATAVYYVRPWASSPTPIAAAAVATQRPFPVQHAGDIVFYNFVSVALGWAVETPQPVKDQSAPFTIFKTVDAGKHWRKQLSGRSQNVITSLLSFKFADAYRGFIAGGDPLALNRTVDGGEHWTRLDLPTSDAVAFQFTDASHLWLLAGPQVDPARPLHVFASFDGGDTWTQRPDLPNDPYFFPEFRNESEGWSGASGEVVPHVWVTHDGGITWARRDLPSYQDTPQPAATHVRLLPRVGVVVYTFPSEGAVRPDQMRNYASLDGGRSWGAISSASTIGDLGNYAFQDATHWWSIQDRALYKTADAGRTWTGVAVEPADLSLLHVFDARHAWAQLDEGFGTELVFTADGGLHWTPTNVPSPE